MGGISPSRPPFRFVSSSFFTAFSALLLVLFPATSSRAQPQPLGVLVVQIIFSFPSVLTRASAFNPPEISISAASVCSLAFEFFFTCRGFSYFLTYFHFCSSSSPGTGRNLSGGDFRCSYLFPLLVVVAVGWRNKEMINLFDLSAGASARVATRDGNDMQRPN